MQEISGYLDNLSAHSQSHRLIRPQIEKLYQDYSNGSKLMSLLEYWLFSLSTIHRCYGDLELQRFLCGDCLDPLVFSNNVEFGIPHNENLRFKEDQGISLWFDKKFPSRYQLPGAPSTSLFSRFFVRYTKNLVAQIPTKLDSELRSSIIEITIEYLSALVDDFDRDHICENIPPVFVSSQIKCNNLRKTSLYCAPIEIMQFRGFEKIFLFDREIKVIGFPHGGGYDVASDDPLTNFEKRLCNIFFGWGFSEHNVHQTRYSAAPHIGASLDDRKVVWVESSKDSKFTAYCYPLLFAVKRDVKIPRYIHRELSSNNIRYVSKTYPGRLQSARYKGLQGSFAPPGHNAEQMLNKHDVVIFDNCMHSLIYFCLENGILFFIVDKKEAIEHYSEKMFLWYEILRENRLFFHDDETGLLGRRIQSLSLQETLPAKIISYYKNGFIENQRETP